MTAPQTASSQVGASGSAPVHPSKTGTVTSTQQNHPTKKPQKTAQSPPQVQMAPKVPRASGEQKAPRRSSKPIINWFQRKLAGTSKAKRTENHPLGATKNMARQNSASSRHMGRITSSPLPVPAVQQLKQQNAATLPRRKTTRSISLNGDEEFNSRQSYGLDDDLSDQSSLNRDSLWSPTSALEADDDASLRPLPPSAPPSPSPSRDSSSYLSDPRTFRSMAASTKPTTLLSIDLNGGMAHIAQVAPSTTTPLHRLAPHARQSSSLSGQGMLNTGTSITFSALPSPQPSSRPSSVRNPGSFSSVTALAPPGHNAVQAPLHTAHHPRNNPRPSSPPMDNASMLTLASSAFASPVRPGLVNYTPSAIGDSVSHYGGSVVFPDGESTSHYVGDDADERLDERDFDASVRALRPRSSRRGSWESEASRWSARVQSPGTSLARGVWFTNSIRTGGPENGEVYETVDEQSPETATREIDSERSSLTGPIVDVTAATPQDELPIIELGEVPVEKKDDAEFEAAVEPSALQHRSSTDTISHPPVSSGVAPVDSDRAEESSEAMAQVEKDVVAKTSD